MNVNPQIINMLKGGNPKQIVMNMLQQNMGNNPMLQNLMSLANANNGTAIEQIARNLAKSKGMDFDSEFNAFKNMLGMK